MRRSILLSVSILIMVIILVAACSESPGGPRTTSSSSSSPAEVCGRFDVTGCEMVGLVFAEPVDLDTAVASGADLGGETIAVYRSEFVCVPDASTTPGAPEVMVASRFAYVDAPLYEERAWDQVDRGQRPPISGQHISQGFWDHWVAEWRSAILPGVTFDGVAAWIPKANRPDAGDRYAAVVDMEERRGDTTDPGTFPGELYVDGEPTAVLPAPSMPDC